jgi:hypothetical protein
MRNKYRLNWLPGDGHACSLTNLPLSKRESQIRMTQRSIHAASRP